MSNVCLIVPAFNHFDYVHGTVRSAFEQIPDVSVLVIDDASPHYQGEMTLTMFDEFDKQRFAFIRFEQNGGLTRSWNAGLHIAKTTLKSEYTICGNSDLVFGPGWWQPIQEALDQGWALAGPLSNAAGTTIGCKQHVQDYLTSYSLSDKPDAIAYTSERLVALGLAPINSPLNGFCLCGKTSVWWENAFDADNVFDPQYKMTLNEDRLQKRWRAKGLKFCVVPRSFVFHYRSVSRGMRYAQGQWLRKGEVWDPEKTS